MRRSQNLPFSLRIYPLLNISYAYLPETTPPSQNMPRCHSPSKARIQPTACQDAPEHSQEDAPRPVYSYKLQCIVCFGLVKMVISTNLKPMVYRNLYENTGRGPCENDFLWQPASQESCSNPRLYATCGDGSWYVRAFPISRLDLTIITITYGTML